MIPYGKHFLDSEDIQAVVDVLENGWLTQGPAIREFEQHLAKHVGAEFAVAVSSGTAALHLSCLALELPEGSLGVTSANTFVASSNAMIYAGLEPDFADISDNDLNINIESYALRSRKVPKVIMPVHFAGAPADMEAVAKFAQHHGSFVIEDASHALGAKYADGSLVGCCKYSDLTTFSFHPVKGVTSGEGGAITTNNPDLYSKLLRLRSHGIEKGNFDLPNISSADGLLQNQENAFTDGKFNPWYYEMQTLGFNYRITDFQACLALSQLKKLSAFLEKRQLLASYYDRILSQNSWVQPKQVQTRDLSSLHIYVVEIDWSAVGKTRQAVMSELFNDGIGTQVHYIPVPMHPYYEKKGFSISDYPATRAYYEKGLTLPLYFQLEKKDLDFVFEKLSEKLGVKSNI